MNPITVELLLKPAPELEALIRTMFGGTQPAAPVPAPAAAAANTQPVAPAPAEPIQPTPATTNPTAAAPTVSVPQSTATSPPAPVAPAVPTTGRTYTLAELGKAGADLMDAGKGADAVALMAKFGVTSISDLAPNQYGAMATELRNLGASI